MAVYGGKKEKAAKADKYREPMFDKGDVVIKYDKGTSLITQEMRAQGMNLTMNLIQELSTRNLGEIKTVDLVKSLVTLFGFFLPKPKEDGNDTVIDVQNSDVKSILNQIGMKND